MQPNFSKDVLSSMMTFAQTNTEHVEQGVNKHVYPDIQYPQLIPVDTSAHEFATSITYYSEDHYGKADWINGNSDDIPIASTERAKHQTGIHMAGVGYAWGYEEIGQAMLAGRNLPSEDAMAARRAYEEFVDRVAMYGDADKGFVGLVNHDATVTPVTANNGNWSNLNTTADQMIDDVNQALLGIGVTTGFTSMADTLLISPEDMTYLGSRRVDGTSTTAYEYLVKNNVYTMTTGQPLTIRTVRGLETAGAGGVRRMVAYRYDPTVLKLHIPMPHRFLPVYQNGPLNWSVPGIFRIGGLDIRRPGEIRYVDGL